MKTTNLKGKNINSFLSAIAISSNYVAVSINSLIGISVYSLLAVMVFIISLWLNRWRIKLFSVVSLIYLSLPIFSIFIFKDSISFTFFLYSVQALMFAFCVIGGFSFKLFAKTIVIIYLLFFWGMLIHKSDLDGGGELMGLSYSVLPGILASIYCIFSKEDRLLPFMSLLCLAFYVFNIISFISRGVVLSIFVYILLISAFYCLKKPKARMPLLIIITSLTIAFIVNFDSIVYFADGIINKNEIKIPFINEIARRISNNTILDGRDVIYERAFLSFLKNPIFGNGTGFYSRYYNSNYEHNFILQMLDEGGVVYAALNIIPLLILLFKALYFKSKLDKETRFMVFFLISVSVVRLCFSYMLWREQGYWMLILIYWSTRIKNRYYSTDYKRSRYDAICN